MNDDNVVDKAKLMIETFTKGLADGVKHFGHTGQELTTVKAIIEELKARGSISIKAPNNSKPAATESKNPNKISSIKAAWNGYLKSAIPDTASDAQKEECMCAFYAGAASVFVGLLTCTSRNGDVTEADFAVLGGYYEELSQFINHWAGIPT